MNALVLDGFAPMQFAVTAPVVTDADVRQTGGSPLSHHPRLKQRVHDDGRSVCVTDHAGCRR